MQQATSSSYANKETPKGYKTAEDTSQYKNKDILPPLKEHLDRCRKKSLP